MPLAMHHPPLPTVTPPPPPAPPHPTPASPWCVQVYAASVMFGYFLRRVDARFRLEASLGTLPVSREDAVARLERLFAMVGEGKEGEGSEGGVGDGGRCGLHAILFHPSVMPS